MKKYDYWIMNAKLNIVFFVIYAGFMTVIGLVLSDNRFELELGLYFAMIILWTVSLINIICIIVIKKRKQKDQSIPLFFIIFISITMISIMIVFIFSLDKHHGNIPYQSEYNEKPSHKESSDQIELETN
ncbi:MAG: hypothetical protein CVV57_05550 [Tenericutes bacterium HGW-Tenericutes-2]|jgi:bacteriorhodopsin|nr:MAG: hypothetical protein CVV57_05550 [Tenericutes bacterium HGW-Tenericutes-2]